MTLKKRTIKTELGFDTEEQCVEKESKASTIWVSGAELATWLDVSQPAITQMKHSGKLSCNDAGKYDLRLAVTSYIKQLRASRKAPTETAANLEASLQYWKVENEKQKNLQWRLRYGQTICEALTQQLSQAISVIRHECKSNPDVIRAIGRLIDALEGADIDRAIMETEGNNELTDGLSDEN